MTDRPQPGLHADDPHRKVPAFDPSVLLQRPALDPAMKRPMATTAGAVLVLLSVAVGVFWIVEVVLLWEESVSHVDISVDGIGQAEQGIALFIAVVIVGAGTLTELVLAVFILLGYNWARVIVMTLSLITICSAFTAWWAQDRSMQIDSTLWSVALDILVLLALSSRSSAAYARRHSRAARREAAARRAEAARSAARGR